MDVVGERFSQHPSVRVRKGDAGEKRQRRSDIGRTGGVQVLPRGNPLSKEEQRYTRVVVVGRSMGGSSLVVDPVRSINHGQIAAATANVTAREGCRLAGRRA